SGARLKLAWYELDSGLRTWASATDLFDAQLGAPCTPTVWDDGVSRCTPALEQIVYADAGCTHAMLTFADDTHRYGAETTSACGAITPRGRFYTARGQTRTLTEFWLHADAGGACVHGTLPKGPLLAADADGASPSAALVALDTVEV